MRDGKLLAVHTPDHRKEKDLPGSSTFGAYSFKLVEMIPDGNLLRAGASLTGGIHRTLDLLPNYSVVSFSGNMWELDPVEVAPRPAPASPYPALASPEAQALSNEGVSLADLENYLAANNAALIVSRNVTTRDAADRQQPYNLRVAGTGTQTTGTGGAIESVSHLQVFQANLVRGYSGSGMYSESIGGRRVLPQPQTDVQGLNPPAPSGPPGSVSLGSDGSMAAIVPARRALTWQLTDPSGDSVVRERYWFTMQPGEIRTCTSCHDPNSVDQAGQAPPTNVPEALESLLQHLKGQGAL